MKRCIWLVVICLVGCSKDPFARAASDLPSAIADAKAAGLPTTPAELVRNVPDAENAAVEYRKAIALLATLKPESPSNWIDAKELPTIGTGRRCTEGEIAKLRDRVGQYERIFQLVDKAALKKHCDFDRDYSQGMALLFPEFARMKDFSKACSARTLLAAHNGDAGLCERSLKSAFALVRHCGEETTLIGRLVAIALGKIGLRAIEDALTESQANPRIVASCLAAIRTAPKSFAALEFDEELVMTDVQLAQLAKKGDGEMVFGVEDMVRSLSGETPANLEADVQAVRKSDLATVRKALRASSFRYYTALVQFGEGKSTEQIFDYIQMGKRDLEKERDPAKLEARMTAGILPQAIAAIRTYEYKYQSTQAGLALLTRQHRQFPANGAPLPDGFSEFLKKSGLKYRQTLAGFEIDASSFNLDVGATINVGVTGFQYPRLKKM